MQEVQDFAYNVEETPTWFKDYAHKTELTYVGFKVVYVYQDEESKVARKFKTGHVIKKSDLYEW